MSVMTLLRRWGLATLLAVTSFASWQAAQRRDIDDVSVEPRDYELALATPVLSARRIPRTLQAPVVDDAIRVEIEDIRDRSPAETCILVRVGDRALEPTTNADLALTPASNQKLLTTYAAVLALGEDFRFVTRAAVDALPVDGVVAGNLYLVGGGDPYLSTDDWWTQYEESGGRYHTRLDELAERIVASGVTSITGSVVGDESHFDSQRTGPWAQRLIEQQQSGPLSALSVNEGYLDWPDRYPGGTRTRTPTDNPPLHAAGALAQLLQTRGVTIGGEDTPATAVATAPNDAIALTEIESPPLVNIITHINSYSSNFGAELLLKQIGVNQQGEGSTEAGATAVQSLLANDGVPMEGVVIRDGSGLSEEDQLTCQALAAVLANAGDDSAYARSLSVGAERGSLRERFVDSPAAGNVVAKTGTLNSVSALSGYVESRTDPTVTLVFTYVANEEPTLSNEQVKGLQEELVLDLTGYPGSPTIEVLSPLDPVTD